MTTFSIDADKLSPAAQAVYDRMLRPFADGVIAGTCSVAEFQGAQASLLLALAEEFAGRMWA